MQQTFELVKEGAYYVNSVIFNDSINNSGINNSGINTPCISPLFSPYGTKSTLQLFLGNYDDDKSTALGMGMKVASAAVNPLDPVFDVRDVCYDFKYWENSWSHAGQTALDVVSIIPLVGIIKYADEVGALLKNGDEVVSLAKEVTDVANSTVSLIKGAVTGIDAGKNIIEGGSDSYKGVRNLAVDFKNGTKLEKHFFDHGSDFGFKTADEYLEGARTFVTKDVTKTTKSFVSEGGTYFRYDTATKEFGIVNQYGGVSTYFKPENGIKYWAEQVAKYAPK